MHKKTLNIFLALLLSQVVFNTQSAQATVNFPNTSIFATDTFFLDLNGNAQLVTVMRYANLDKDFVWNSSTPLDIPIRITSFSGEKPNLTWLSVGDTQDQDYSIKNYTISARQSDLTYNHDYVIEVSEKRGWQGIFQKNSIITIKMITKINGISLNTGNDYKVIFNLSSSPLSNKKFQSYVIRVNLPNDPYHWDEILDTYPIYDYRGSFGNGESVEWQYNENSNIYSPILIDYSIHPDQIKIDLDNITKISEYLGWIAVGLGIIAVVYPIPGKTQKIKNFINWLKRKWDTF